MRAERGEYSKPSLLPISCSILPFDNLTVIALNVKMTLKGLLRISCGMQWQAPRFSLHFSCCPCAPRGLIAHAAF